jgi:PAS domain S-box-containing protein
MTVWCTYPLAKSGAAEILDVARTHQFCLTRRSGNWEVIETPEIKLAKREISKLNEELERRVGERTEQLLQANEQLRNEICERKRVEEELRRSEAYLAEGQNISHTGSWAWNVTTGGLFWSLEHFRIFGLDPEKVKLTYEMVLNCVHPEDRSLLQQTFENAVRNGEECALDFRIVRPDGIRHIRSVAHAVFAENGAVIEYVGTVIDTTERKRGEEALRQAHDELAHASRVLTMGELTSSIAHEVNQPLGAIVTNGNASLRLISRNPPDVEHSREAIECMISDAMRASEVIKRIRAMLKKSVPEKTLLNMNETIHDVIGLTAGQLANSQIALRTNLAPDRLMVLGDRVQLQQVMLNLILNSNEAMSQPGWQFRELVIGSQLTKPNEITVEVRDSGMGFEQGNEDRIFDAFVTTKHGGLGLGLSISRTIIEAHGGRLWCTPNESQGATFQFTLPTSNEN